jgi:hypothetical protein
LFRLTLPSASPGNCLQVEGLATGQPVLMVCEDVHWSDPTTRELLDLHIDRVPTLRVLVVITFRPEFGRPSARDPLSLNRLPAGQPVATRTRDGTVAIR